MKITVIGAGYVGLVTGTCLAEVGNDVICFDTDSGKIGMLQAGEIPIYEPGLTEMIRHNVNGGRLHFTDDIEKATHFGTVQFIAVGTPPAEDGHADVKYVLEAARNIGRYMNDYKVVVDKSTVPVGTADAVRELIAEELLARGVNTPFSVVSNPEFLKEGAAIDDFMRPGRIVLGCDDEQAALNMRALYAPFQRHHDRLILMDIRSAELTKYAANAMLATRISFMNELANLAEKLGADIEHVRKGIAAQDVTDRAAGRLTAAERDHEVMIDKRRTSLGEDLATAIDAIRRAGRTLAELAGSLYDVEYAEAERGSDLAAFIETARRALTAAQAQLVK